VAVVRLQQHSIYANSVDIQLWMGSIAIPACRLDGPSLPLWNLHPTLHHYVHMSYSLQTSLPPKNLLPALPHHPCRFELHSNKVILPFSIIDTRRLEHWLHNTHSPSTTNSGLVYSLIQVQRGIPWKLLKKTPKFLNKAIASSTKLLPIRPNEYIVCNCLKSFDVPKGRSVQWSPFIQENRWWASVLNRTTPSEPSFLSFSSIPT
jgi:hypothetical protein